MASECISNLAQSQPPSASPNLLHHGLQVYFQTRSITACKFARSWPSSAYLQPRLITASKCISRLARLRPARSHDHGPQVHISKLARSRPPSVSPDSLNYVLRVRSITASKCISKLARLWPPQVHLQTRSITASEYISEFTGSLFSGAPRIALKLRLQPVQIYRV